MHGDKDKAIKERNIYSLRVSSPFFPSPVVATLIFHALHEWKRLFHIIIFDNSVSWIYERLFYRSHRGERAQMITSAFIVAFSSARKRTLIFDSRRAHFAKCRAQRSREGELSALISVVFGSLGD